jgi:hypothetical protein
MTPPHQALLQAAEKAALGTREPMLSSHEMEDAFA